MSTRSQGTSPGQGTHICWGGGGDAVISRIASRRESHICAVLGSNSVLDPGHSGAPWLQPYSLLAIRLTLARSSLCQPNQTSCVTPVLERKDTHARFARPLLFTSATDLCFLHIFIMRHTNHLSNRHQLCEKKNSNTRKY